MLHTVCLIGLVAFAQSVEVQNEEVKKATVWKKVKPRIVKVVTNYGVTECCGVHRGEPLYPGETRQHMCDLLNCRVSMNKGVRILEKWRCEGCLSLTPQCKRYQRKRAIRDSSKDQRDAVKLARHTRKVRYRQMKRAQIKAERRDRRAKLQQLRLKARMAKKASRSGKKTTTSA